MSRSLFLPLRNELINQELINEALTCGLTCVAGIRRLPCRAPRIRRLPCREWADSVVGLGKAHDFLPYGLYKKALASEIT